MEADPRHAERVIRYMGVETGKASPVPGSKEKAKIWSDAADLEGGQDGNVNPELCSSEASTYRTVAATLNYFASDRPDIQFAVKEAARGMSAPHQSHWAILKKIARYLRYRPRLILKYDYRPEGEGLTGYSDSDYAGCVATRRSASGGCIMTGRSLLKSWSKQQQEVALSSAEAETYALVTASCEVLGLQACARDLGMNLQGELFTDASAALGKCQGRASERSDTSRHRHYVCKSVRKDDNCSSPKSPGQRIQLMLAPSICQRICWASTSPPWGWNG